MSAEQLVQRLVSAETGIDAQKLRLARFEEYEWSLIVQAMGVLSELPIFIDDTPSISALQLRTKARRIHAEHGLDLILVDYLQLMTGDVRVENRVQEVSYISRMLKALARELDAPVVGLSQLSRAVEQRTDKMPVLSDLRESGSLEQDADVVMFIYREELYKPETEKQHIADIKIAKHRHGPTGTIQLFFKKELAQFRDAETRIQPVEFS
jgi:replicative DNA helicase